MHFEGSEPMVQSRADDAALVNAYEGALSVVAVRVAVRSRRR